MNPNTARTHVSHRLHVHMAKFFAGKSISSNIVRLLRMTDIGEAALRYIIILYNNNKHYLIYYEEEGYHCECDV